MANVEPSFVLYALLLDPGCCLRAHFVLIELVEPGQKKKMFIPSIFITWILVVRFIVGSLVFPRFNFCLRLPSRQLSVLVFVFCVTKMDRQPPQPHNSAEADNGQPRAAIVEERLEGHTKEIQQLHAQLTWVAFCDTATLPPLCAPD